MIIQRPSPPVRDAAAGIRRVVVKLGTSTLTRGDGSLAHGRFHALADSVAAVKRAGREVVLVTSGAVGLGGARLRRAPGDAPTGRAQTRAAVGQARLMALCAEAFERHWMATGQLLVSARDLMDRRRAGELRATLEELLALGVLPVLNGNDAITPAAADGGTGIENDRLAALTASAVGADLLLLLTDVDGVFDADPRASAGARLLRLVHDVAPVLAAAGGPGRGTGGMRTKLDAVRLATRGGCAVVIANGSEPRVVERIIAGEALGTLFPAMPRAARRARMPLPLVRAAAP
jgi:glutamate 5-kinase